MKLRNTLLAVLLFGACAYASEHKTEEHHAEKPHYIALKGMYTFGENYTNDEGVLEEGEDGYGIAIDLGHRIGYGFSVEIDFSYEKADVTAHEEEAGKIVLLRETAKYYTSSIDLAYVYELTHSFGVLAKVGYEYEYEDIAGTTADDTGFIFAAGMEYSINHTYKALVEYETSTVDGPKGDMIYAGVMYNF